MSALKCHLTLFVLASSVLAGCAGASASPPPQCPPTLQGEPAAAVAPAVATQAPQVEAAPALSSWVEGPTRKAIEDFVKKVTDPQSPDLIPPAERIAVFDNDGTLWSEQPVYVQVAFVLDRVKALAPEHPEWKHKQPFKAALEGDLKAVMAGGIEGFLKLVLATHAGVNAEAFDEIVREWLATARHPKYDKPYTELTYAPMVELLQYLRAHGFKTFIVSGGGIEFMRPWTELAYGIPPEQVVGSRIKSKWENGTLRRLSEVGFVDDGAGKPVGIYEHIGRHPVFAAGNSDGDLEMLQYTKTRRGPSFALLVHHTDGERETAYGRESHVGKLDKALDAAPKDGFVVVDMKQDWKHVFAFQR
ncbi:MAG TPA: HAD family hydrolase [Polyangiaceae bacterium]